MVHTFLSVRRRHYGTSSTPERHAKALALRVDGAGQAGWSGSDDEYVEAAAWGGCGLGHVSYLSIPAQIGDDYNAHMISTDELNRLLGADESDTLERKASLADTDAIRNTLIAFANDLAGRGGGKLIIGQNPDKTISGISVGADEAQQALSNLARNRCRPSIPTVIDICEHDTKTIVLVDVKASPARPHFRGDCYVRQGSTNRVATDAEIMVLHSATVDPKVRQLLTWQQEGKTRLTCVQLPTGMWGQVIAELVEINSTYIVLRHSPSFSMTVPLDDLRLGYDSQRSQPQITFQRHH